MSSRRRNQLFSSNLDALMDTVTNVVGILIVILILMQVGVGQSLKKILSDLPQVSEEELANMREEAEEQRRKHELLQDTIDKQRMRTETERKELARLNPELTTLETAAERSPVAILDTASIKDKNLSNARELDSLRRQMAELLAEQAKLKAALDTTPALPPPPDKIVRIPNSRPLAETAKIERYLVTNGYVYEYDPEGAKKLLLHELRNGGFQLEKEKIKNADGTTQIIYDQDKVVKYFEQRRLSLGGMEIRVPYNQTGTRLTMELVPGTSTAQSISSATQFTSRFQNEMRRMKAGNIIAWFNVSRGAFDTYLQAREICESIGTAAGWEMVTTTSYSEPLTEFDVNRMIEPPPPATPPPWTPPPTPTPRPRGTPRPPAATPVPMPKATPPPAPIKIDPPKKKLD